MRRKRLGPPVRADYVTDSHKVSCRRLNEDLRQGMRLYQKFNRFGSSQTIKVHYPRLIPPVVVELGELVGLIYRSDKWQAGRSRAYIHLMQNPPRLVSSVDGTQLYIVGGSYQVTQRGIEG